ncbi:MAG: helix-hairpin-helix domain-containing protein [Chloroflexota bacterium]
MVTVSEVASVGIGNRRIANILFNIATILDLAEDNIYRVRAYRHAARRILALREDAAAILARGEELPLEGVGKRVRVKLAELITSGRLAFYEDLLEDQPEHIRALMAVEGIGPKTAQRLYAGLGVRTVGDLIAAAERQQVQTLFGFGKVREASLAQAARTVGGRLAQVA